MNLIKNKKGNSLMISIVVIFILLAMVLFLSNLTKNNLKTTNNIINSIKAKYAAETGIEKTLYLINKQGRTLDNVINSVNYRSETLNNLSSFLIKRGDQEIETLIDVGDMNGNDTEVINITNGVSDIKSFKITWDSPQNGQVGVYVIRYYNGYVEDYLYYKNYNSWEDLPIILNLEMQSLPGRTYEFNITPWYWPISNVNVEFYSQPNAAQGTAINVTNIKQYSIKSIGNYNKNNYSIESSYLINRIIK